VHSPAPTPRTAAPSPRGDATRRKGTAGARLTFEARRKRVGSVRTSATQVPNSPSPSLNSSSGLTQSPRSITVLSAAAPPYRTECRATRRRKATQPPSHTVFFAELAGGVATAPTGLSMAVVYRFKPAPRR
jgi:hypothetical protein